MKAHNYVRRVGYKKTVTSKPEQGARHVGKSTRSPASKRADKATYADVRKKEKRRGLAIHVTIKQSEEPTENWKMTEKKLVGKKWEKGACRGKR